MIWAEKIQSIISSCFYSLFTRSKYATKNGIIASVNRVAAPSNIADLKKVKSKTSFSINGNVPIIKIGT